MDFSFTEKEEAFRQELRTWLEENLPEGWIEGKRELPEDEQEQKEFLRNWQKKLHEGGWVGISWPKEYGGRGASLIEEVIYEQEMARVNAPPIINLVGVAMVGPTLLQIGTEEQKKKYIPKILNNEHVWCQGYSEPIAGSDLAALQTRAVKKGDRWIINGHKIWTSYAHYDADYCFLLARTDNTGKKHHGITAFIVDMHQDGVEISPIRSINDERQFNELFFTDAVAYDADIVGEVDRGWMASLTLLSHERVGVARRVFHLQKLFEDTVKLAQTVTKNGRPLIENPVVKHRLIEYRAKTKASLLNYYRHLTNTIRNGKPGPEGSLDKLSSSELLKDLYGYALSLHGAIGTLWKESAAINNEWQDDYFRSFGFTIAGGTSEIQRNIVAERILGLPKDIKY